MEDVAAASLRIVRYCIAVGMVASLLFAFSASLLAVAEGAEAPMVCDGWVGDNAPCRAAVQLVEQLAESAALEARRLTEPGRDPSMSNISSAFSDLVGESFDFVAMARVSLGKAWAAASSDQQTAFIGAYGLDLTRAYHVSVGRGETGRLTIVAVRPLNGNRARVSSRFHASTAVTRDVDWIVENSSPGKVVAILIDGVSLARMQGDTYRAFLRRNNGDIDRLIAALRNGALGIGTRHAR